MRSCHTKFPKFRFHLLSLLVLAGWCAADAAAADYPVRPIRFIVSSAPGGTPDISSRLMTAELNKRLGWLFVVDNRPGASGTLGMDTIAKSAPDGYTMGQGNITNLVITRSVLGKLPYDVDRDLGLVLQYGYTCNLLAVAPSLPINSVQELLDYARRYPGKLLYGSAGNGSTMHMSAELLKMMTRTQMTHVPYKASQQAISEIVGGQIHFMFDNMSSILPHVSAGRLRGLGVSSLRRWTAAPEFPPIAESGVPGFEVIPWGGIVVPARVPKEIVARINQEFNNILVVPEVRARMISLGTEPAGGTSEAFIEHVKRENAKWAEVVKRAGIKVD